MMTKIGSALFLIAFSFLVFVGGAFVILTGAFPHDFLSSAYQAGKAFYTKKTAYRDPLATDLWRVARTTGRGVTVHAAGQAYRGFTLYSSGDGPCARLVDVDGSLVHQWCRPYREVWGPTAAVKCPQSDNLVYFDKVRLLPNGDLIAIYVCVGDTPWGYGMVKLDRDSNVIWKYLAHTHHDFDIAPDGRIVALTHDFTSDKMKGFEHLARPRLHDWLAILSPDGKEQKKIDLTRALARSRYFRLLQWVPHFSLADPLHTNSVEYITAEKARNFPFGKAGQVLLSFREPGIVAVLDAESEEVVWATRGPWVGQHSPHLLANGHILLFDNLGGFIERNASRVIEFDPRTMAIVWRYAGDDVHPFESPERSSAERLPNGNTLITESEGGRLFEVTPEGQIVWEFVNPVRAGKNDGYSPIVSGGQRIPEGQLDPSFRASIVAKRKGKIS